MAAESCLYHRFALGLQNKQRVFIALLIQRDLIIQKYSNELCSTFYIPRLATNISVKEKLMSPDVTQSLLLYSTSLGNTRPKRLSIIFALIYLNKVLLS